MNKWNFEYEYNQTKSGSMHFDDNITEENVIAYINRLNYGEKHKIIKLEKEPKSTPKKYKVTYTWPEYTQRYAYFEVEAFSKEEAEILTINKARDMVKCDVDIDEADEIEELES